MYSPGIAHLEEFADDFFAQRAAAIQAEFVTAEARGAPQLDGVQPQALPHNHVMILVALPPLNLTSFWMMQPDAIFSASHAGCSIARRSGRSKRIQQTSSPRLRWRRGSCL